MPWIISDAKTGHRGQGLHGRWYTPGWPWPFKGGVGVVAGNCSFGEGETRPAAAPAECCNPIFGTIKGVKCLETAHHMVLEQALAAPGAWRGAATLPLGDAVANGTLDGGRLRAIGGRYAQQVLWVEPPEPLPPVAMLAAAEEALVADLEHDECRDGVDGSGGADGEHKHKKNGKGAGGHDKGHHQG